MTDQYRRLMFYYQYLLSCYYLFLLVNCLGFHQPYLPVSLVRCYGGSKPQSTHNSIYLKRRCRPVYQLYLLVQQPCGFFSLHSHSGKCKAGKHHQTDAQSDHDDYHCYDAFQYGSRF